MFEPLLIAVILVALVFEFINGFHDTANAIATSVYTHTLRAGVAIGMAAVMNFCGALVSERVAMTISKGIVATEPAQYVILAALIGAVIWNIITWYFGIPSSSSHALIGSLIGAVIVAAGGVRSILWGGVLHKIVIPLFTSPILGLIAGFLVMKLFFVLFRNISHPRINRVFSKLQVISAAFVAFSHGNNDAQKTMGIITLALISSGALSGDAGIPLWVKISCAGVMALGTSIGGRRIMKTVGHKVTGWNPSADLLLKLRLRR